MDLEEFSQELINKCRKLNINIVPKKTEKFYKYMKLLIEWNEKVNLTAIVEPKEIILKHFVDSLTILNNIHDNDKVIDIGTGAGFPGLPIAIMNNKSNVTLLDSLNKRVNFLNEVLKKIELNNVTTIHSRAEDFGKDNKYREKYDIAVSRAVAPLNILLEYMLPTVKVGGKCICMKSSSIEEELNMAKTACGILGGEIVDIQSVILPDTDIERKNIVIKKVKNTPLKYPRKAGMPSKEPIR